MSSSDRNRQGLLILVLVALFTGLYAAACSNIGDDPLYPQDTRGGLDVLDSCPLPGESNVSTGAVVKLLFNKELDPATVTDNAILMGSGRWHVKGDLYYDDRTVTYVPTTVLDANSKYTIYITSSLRDIDGFAYTKELSVISFQTGSETGVTCR